MEHCKKQTADCVEVNASRLDSYVEKYVNSTGNINHLSIDIEGYDVSALLSAKKILHRIEYMEFEYSWRGEWRNHKLSDIIQMLDESNFTCFWIGNHELWRITGCFQEHYDKQFWSNIGCGNRVLAPNVVKSMEHVFQQTLSCQTKNLNFVNSPYEIPRERIYINKLSRNMN